MEKFEKNVLNSFRLAKSDIIKLQDSLMEMKRTQARILEKLAKLETKKGSKPVVRAKRVSKKQIYLASKDGDKFHDAGCIALKKVERKNLVSYPTKNKAISKGLQPCGICVPN